MFLQLQMVPGCSKHSSGEYAENTLLKSVMGTDAAYEQKIDVVIQRRKLPQQWLRSPTNPVISSRNSSQYLT